MKALTILKALLICLGLASASPYYSDSEFEVDREIALMGVEHDPSPPISLEYGSDHLEYQLPQEVHQDFDLDAYLAQAEKDASASAEKSNKEYAQAQKTVKDFERAIAGKHKAARHQSQYSDKGARRTGHDNSAKHYADKHAEKQSSHGGDYLVAKHEDKGSKTKGFHRVHHKEEYKKDRQFYDEKNAHGHYRRYGDFGASNKASEGASERGSKYDSGRRHLDYGKRGFEDRGSLVDQLKKYAAANGYAGYGATNSATGGLGDYKGYKDYYGYR